MTQEQKRVKELLRYGDIARIALRVPYSYQHVSRVLRGERYNEDVLTEALDYLESRPRTQLSQRLENLRRAV